MKALVLQQYGRDMQKALAVADCPQPLLKPHQVLVAVHAAAVNPVDYKIVEGNLKVMLKLKRPAPLGYDFAGEVVAIGETVQHLKVGDKVYGSTPLDAPGAMAEFLAVDASLVVQMPESLTFAEAASLPMVGATTIQAFEKVQVKAGDHILIHAGSGGVGSFAIQYAKALGAYVYTTTSTSNVAWVKALGADRVIDYKKEDYTIIAQNLDVVYDTLGGDYAQKAFGLVKRGGCVVSIAGGIDAKTVKELGLNRLIQLLLFFKGRKLRQLSKRTGVAYHYVLLSPDANTMEYLSVLVREGKVQPVLNQVYPLEQGVHAFQHQQGGRAKGKVVIQIRDS